MSVLRVLAAIALIMGIGPLLPAGALAQGSCDVVVQLDEPVSANIVAFGLDYSATNGEFIGNSTSPNGNGGPWGPDPLACSNVAAEFFDAIDDKAGTLSLFFGDSAGLAGPLVLTSCVFEFPVGVDCPDANAFAVVDQAFPDMAGFAFPYPELSAPAASIGVTPRAAVCGDGFREAPEQCDDGNTVDGDCCSSNCTLDPIGTACPDDSLCTSGETCDGVGGCEIAATVQCDDSNLCTADSCDAATGECLHAATNCGDFDPCTDDVCDPASGQCSNPATSCDDGVLCTHDFCVPWLGCQALVEPTPAADGCIDVTRSKLDLADNATKDGRDRVKISGKFAGGDVRNPTAGTDYAICLFDTAAATPLLVAKISIPAGPPWIATGSHGFKYADRLRSEDGVAKVQVRQNSRGRSKFRLVGKGEGLPLSGPWNASQYFAQDPSVIMEIQNTAGGCWSATYDGTNGTIILEPDRFKVKTTRPAGE